MKAGLSLGTEHGHRLASHAESGSCDCPEARWRQTEDSTEYSAERERLAIMRAILYDPVSRRLFLSWLTLLDPDVLAAAPPDYRPWPKAPTGLPNKHDLSSGFRWIF